MVLRDYLLLCSQEFFLVFGGLDVVLEIKPELCKQPNLSAVAPDLLEDI